MTLNSGKIQLNLLNLLDIEVASDKFKALSDGVTGIYSLSSRLSQPYI